MKSLDELDDPLICHNCDQDIRRGIEPDINCLMCKELNTDMGVKDDKAIRMHVRVNMDALVVGTGDTERDAVDDALSLVTYLGVVGEKGSVNVLNFEPCPSNETCKHV